MNYLTCPKVVCRSIVRTLKEILCVAVISACRTLSTAGRLLNFDKIVRRKTQKCDTKGKKKHKFYAKLRRVLWPATLFVAKLVGFCGFLRDFSKIGKVQDKDLAQFWLNCAQKFHFSCISR